MCMWRYVLKKESKDGVHVHCTTIEIYCVFKEEEKNRKIIDYVGNSYPLSADIKE